MPSQPSPIWAVTSYFNPTGSARRRANFDAFRRHLKIPLLAVELGKAGSWHLAPDAADMVVHLHGEEFIWQKERLLNIGIGCLPPEAEYVAWIDCDVLFSDPSWGRKAVKQLERQGGLLQLFAKVHHLRPEVPCEQVEQHMKDKANWLFTEECSVKAMLSGEIAFGVKPMADVEDARLPVRGLRNGGYTPGIAWAASRKALEAAPLYDRNVIGGGDVINLLSNDEQLSIFNVPRNYSRNHLALIRERIMAACAAGLFGAVGYIDQQAWHLWHGTMENRNYRTRHAVLSENRFDPGVDVMIAANGTLCWREPDGALARAVRDYFVSRQEDGPAA